MAEKNYGNNSQLAELVKYISDEMKFPIIGAGGGYAPIGTINFFDATTAPLGWLACDGSIHNISDYPDLATFYASQHGASNYYGGNGTTTFAVPNLQGEFLRGAGTNGHTNQGSGGSVGEHQDATEHYAAIYTSAGLYVQQTGGTANANKDSYLNNNTSYVNANKSSGGTGSGNDYKSYTSRPTNTSFLICVKATLSDTELNNMHVYSPNEHQVGWWQQEVDGVLKQKPVWERTVTGTATGTNSQWISIATISIILPNVNEIVSVSKVAHSTSSSTDKFHIPEIDINANNQLEVRQTFTGSSMTYNYKITLEYTKTSDTWQTV